ncbi:hypothetical protein NE237_015006 [Protea cynaroides]|uniref:Uncharacterized protein n=1 Tax=Protea cynaroides TaxID=273540 RepID=A0A9Q0QQI1_9MAGN|nr:hypothetical protein NE237_015006 [Protea cynaroides]
MGKRTKSDDKKKGQSFKLERPAASPKSAKSSTKMTKEVAETVQRKKKFARSNTVLRRSQRIQNVTPCTQGKDVEAVIESIDLCESDKEDHHKEDPQDVVWHQSYEEKKMQEEDSGIRRLEGKIDYLTIVLGGQEKFHEAKSMNLCAGVKAQVENDNDKLNHVDCHKKIASLQEENHQLVVKLENALGKLQAYEKGHILFSDTVEKLKDAMLISTITKTNEMMFGLSSPRANIGDSSAPTVAEAKASVAKKKKNAKSRGRK